jgi:hypothetical protein
VSNIAKRAKRIKVTLAPVTSTGATKRGASTAQAQENEQS